MAGPPLPPVPAPLAAPAPAAPMPRHAPLRRGHSRRLRPRRGGGWLVPGSWGLGGDELAGVRVDVVEVVVVVVVVVVVGVVCRHLLDAGGDAPDRLHVRLRGRPALCPPPFVPSSPLGSHAPSRLSLGARGALALALWPRSRPLPVSRVPPPVPHALARPLTHLPIALPPAPGLPARAPVRPSRALAPSRPPAPSRAIRCLRSAPPRCCALPGPLAGRPVAFAAAVA